MTRPTPSMPPGSALLLTNCACPPSSTSGPTSPSAPTRRAGPPPASSRPRRTRARRARPPAHRAPPRRSHACRPARPSTTSTSTPCRWSPRPRSWRSPPATAWLEKGANLLAVRAARRRQEPSGGRHRPRPDRERLARPVHAHHRPRPAPPGRATRTGTGSRHRQARPGSIC